MTDKGSLIVLSGPSGTGKGTLLSEFKKCFGSEKVVYSVSDTTRSPRPGEIPDVSYHYITNEEFDKKKEFIMDSPFYTDEMDYEKLEWKELSIEEKEQLMSDLMESISTYAELRGVERTIDQEQTYYAACEKIDKFDAKTVYNGIIEKKIKQIFGEDVTVIHSCNWNKDDGINLIAIRIITKEGKEIFFGDDDIDSTLKAAIESLRTYEDSENDVDGKFEFLQEAFEFVNYEFKLNDKGDKIKRDRNAEKANKDITEQSTYIEYDEK